MQTSSNIEDQTFAATAPREPRDILLAVTAKLADELYPDQGIGASVNLDSDLGSDLGFDSLTRMELVHRIEEEFNTALSDEALGRADSLRDLLTSPTAYVHGSAGCSRACGCGFTVRLIVDGTACMALLFPWPAPLRRLPLLNFLQDLGSWVLI